MITDMEQQAKPLPLPHGRRSKGDRKATMVYLPVEIRAVADAIAERDGLSISDVLIRVVAEALEMTAPNYCYPKPGQEELPLSEAS